MPCSRLPLSALESPNRRMDSVSNHTLGAGMIAHSLRRAENVSTQRFDVTSTMRAGLKGQQSAIIWLTGLPGAGKSTIANIVERRLTAEGRHCYILDGDNLRRGIN